MRHWPAKEEVHSVAGASAGAAAVAVEVGIVEVDGYDCTDMDSAGCDSAIGHTLAPSSALA